MSFIKFPLFMRRKKKVEILDFMIAQNKKSMRKNKCDICNAMNLTGC